METTTITVLGKYFDALHLSLFGEPRRAGFEKLRTAKNTRRVSDLGAIPGVPGGPCMLRPRGGGRYPFIIQNGIFEMRLTDARGLPRMMPRVSLQLRASALYEHALEEIEIIAETVAGHFLEAGFRVQVRRVDVAADFQAEGWTLPQLDDVITYGKKLREHDGKTPILVATRWTKWSALRVLIYNKSLELRGSGKEGWMTERWRAKEAYTEGLPVFRAEFQFYRESLRQLKAQDPETGQLRGIDTLGDLRSSLGDLIRYVVGGTASGPGSEWPLQRPETAILSCAVQPRGGRSFLRPSSRKVLRPAAYACVRPPRHLSRRPSSRKRDPTAAAAGYDTDVLGIAT